MSDDLDRRDFLKVMGMGAAGINAWALSSSSSGAAVRKPVPGMGLRIGAALKVKPVLVYSLYQRKQAVSWRPWGGLHNQNDVNEEANNIEKELNKLRSEADFPVEVLPLARVNSDGQANVVRNSDCDVILVYAASGSQKWLENLAASGKPGVMFLRHDSGPVYLWYEVAHPRFLRKTGDEFKESGIGLWDIVVDDYGEVLWRLRACYGLKNTLGTRIVAVGGAGGWGDGYKVGPAKAKEIWKFDIKPVTYEELEPMLKKKMAEAKALERARRQTDDYLAQKGVSLHTDKKFLVNAFLLTELFRELMAEADAPAITINSCMGTIMPMAQTTACMPLSLINDEGLMAFCESDFVVIPSGILLRYISGKPVFFNDPTHPHDGVTTCAHCTAPRRMNGRDYEPVEIHTHFESDYGAAPKVNMRTGQIITNLIPNFSSSKWLGFRGKIIEHPFYDICRSQIDLEIEGDWRRLLEDMQGFHWMTCYGDYLREVGYALNKVGIQWDNLNEERKWKA
ncbi:MAG: sugar isomerase [Planctomycetota bacterium]|jgi:hypothetical protein